MSWHLQIGGAAPQSFAYLGLSRLRRTIRSQHPGSFTFTADGAGTDSDALAPEGAICTVLLGATPYFSGRLHRIPRKGSGAAESIDYQLFDAWNDFEKNVYQQQWNIIQSIDESGHPTLAAEYRSELILGIDLSGNRLTSGQVIQDIVQWAIGVGAWCQLGVVGVAAPVPLDEVTDLPCSECIKKMLRYTPDAVTWFDYSTSPPTFNITRRAACTPVSVPFTGDVESVDIKALPDLLIPSCVIRYLQENKTDGVPSINVIVDDFPEGSTGLEYGALVQTTRMAGTDSTYQKNYIQADPIPLDNSTGDAGGPSDDPSIAWWLKHVPWLQQFSPSRLAIANITGSVDPGQKDPSGDGNLIDSNITNYPNELISGAIASWMNCHVAHTTWTAQVTYNYPADSDDESNTALAVFGLSAGGASPPLPLYAQVIATSAVTQPYAQLSTYIQAEAIPTGLAETIYTSLSTLQYEGTYTIVNSESTYWSLGIVLNITGGRPEWSTMNALLQELDDDLDNGRTTLTFGPAGHLTLQDFMEQLRSNRSRNISRHISERQTGQPGDSPQVIGDTHTATVASSTLPAAPSRPSWLDYISDQDPGSADDPPATWDVLLGYGQSSFAGATAIDHADPIERLEISVGQDGSAWDGSDHPSTDDAWAFSLQSGNDTPSDDILLIATGNGSILLTPDNPSIYLGPNIDPRGDDSDTQHINIDLGSMVIELQDDSGSCITLDLSDSPIINILNSATSSTSSLDENSLVLSDAPSGGAITLDASTTMGKSISTQTVTVCVDGVQKSMLVIGSDSLTNYPLTHLVPLILPLTMAPPDQPIPLTQNPTPHLTIPLTHQQRQLLLKFLSRTHLLPSEIPAFLQIQNLITSAKPPTATPFPHPSTEPPP
jgi:hypothetical protein